MAARDHAGEHGAGECVGTDDVGVEDLEKLLGAGVQSEFLEVDPGIVDEDVDSAELRDGVFVIY